MFVLIYYLMRVQRMEPTPKFCQLDKQVRAEVLGLVPVAFEPYATATTRLQDVFDEIERVDVCAALVGFTWDGDLWPTREGIDLESPMLFDLLSDVSSDASDG